MQGLWKESNWNIEGDALRMPGGRCIALSHIRQWQADTIEGRIDLSGTWSGWRVRQQFLLVPSGSLRRGRVSECHLRHLVQVADWDRIDVSRRQLDLFQRRR